MRRQNRPFSSGTEPRSLILNLTEQWLQHPAWKLVPTHDTRENVTCTCSGMIQYYSHVPLGLRTCCCTLAGIIAMLAIANSLLGALWKGMGGG